MSDLLPTKLGSFSQGGACTYVFSQSLHTLDTVCHEALSLITNLEALAHHDLLCPSVDSDIAIFLFARLFLIC